MEKKPRKKRRTQSSPKQIAAAKATAANLLSPNPVPMGQIMASVGYGKGIQNQPGRITESEGFKALLDHYLPEDKLAQKHVELLNATRMDHMVFPLGPKDEDDINFSGARVSNKEDEEDDEREEFKERTTLTDKEIIEMLAEVNCKVRRIVHGETARHVYFWSADNNARDKALDKAYKLRRRYGEEAGVPPQKSHNTYNFIFSPDVQQRVKTIEAEIKSFLIQTPNAQPSQENVEPQSEGSGDPQ